MSYTGTIKGNVIQFNHHLPFTDGVQVVVNIIATSPIKDSPPPQNSPQAWLQFFADTLSEEEAEQVLFGAQACRTIDPEMWEPSDK